jgi:hypothetical protein
MERHAFEAAVVVFFVGITVAIIGAIFPLLLLLGGPFMLYAITYMTMYETEKYLDERETSGVGPVADLESTRD